MEHSMLTLGGLTARLHDAVAEAETAGRGADPLDLASALGGLLGRTAAYAGMIDHYLTYCGISEVNQYELREFLRTFAGECEGCRSPLAEWNDRLTDDENGGWCPPCASTDMHDNRSRWVDYHKQTA